MKITENFTYKHLYMSVSNISWPFVTIIGYWFTSKWKVQYGQQDYSEDKNPFSINRL